MGQTSPVVPMYLLVLVQCFAMAVTDMVAETPVEVFLKGLDPVALGFLKSSSSPKFPCPQCSRMEWFQEST